MQKRSDTWHICPSHAFMLRECVSVAVTGKHFPRICSLYVSISIAVFTHKLVELMWMCIHSFNIHSGIFPVVLFDKSEKSIAACKKMHLFIYSAML